MNNRTHVIAAFSTILILSFFITSELSAQTPPTPPGSDAGSQATRFQRESELERRAVEKKKPQKPEIDIQEEEAKPAPAGPSFVLTGVKISGATLFKEEEFLPLYERYINNKVTWEDVGIITNNIKALYKTKGYLTTNVYIPEQDVVGGKIEIRILEGTVGDVKVEGNKWFSANLIKSYLHAKKNDILNIFKLNRDLLRLNQNSDMEVRTVIRAGAEPGSTDIVLKVKDKFPHHAGVAFDNQGTRLVGRDRTSFSFRSTNISGHNDSIFFNTIMSALSKGNFISYMCPMDTYGMKVGVDIVTFDTKIGREYKVFDITGHTQIYTPKIVSEMHLSEDFQADTEVGMDIKSIKKFTLGERTSDDELRMPYALTNFTKLDSLFGGGQTSLMSKFIFSTDGFLGASHSNHVSASRSGTGGFFFECEIVLRRIQRMPFDSYISARAQFQNATHTLPSSEQMQFGGANYNRGYPEGDYMADYGANLNLDWVLPMPFVPKDFKLPYSETPLRHQFEPVVFMDMGGGKLKDVGSGERRSKFLMSLGGGLRVQINKNLFLRLEWAERVGDRPGQGQGASNFHIAFQGEV
jgi:hemolysin activation/secretion protein